MAYLRRLASISGDRRPFSRAAGVWALIAAIAAAAATITMLIGGFGPLALDVPSLVLVLALGVAFGAAEVLAVHLHYGRHAVSYSFSEIPLLLGVVFLPAPAVLLARALGAAWGLGIKRRQPVQKLSFNLAHRWLETVVAVAVVGGVLAGASPASTRGWAAVASSVIAIEILGSGVVALVIRLVETPRPQQLFWRPLLAGVPAVIANSSVALLIITLITVQWRALWMVAVILGLLVVFQRAHGQLQQRHATLERVAAFGQSVSAKLETDAVATVTLAEIRRQLSARLAGLILTEQFAPAGATIWDCEEGGTPPESAIAALRSLQGPAILARHSRSDVEVRLLAALGLRDAILVPLHHGDEVMGFLLAGDRLGDAVTFSAQDMQVCTALANNAAIALHNGRLASELRSQVRDNEHQAFHDALTGLPNRRLLRKRLAEARGPVGVLLLDLDRFKEVNDTLGHQTGDELLQMVAHRLSRHLPDALCIARLGGDEFAIGIRAENDAEALAVAKTLRTVLGAPFVLADMSLSIDASIGVATSTLRAEPGLLLQHADVAMYNAKNGHTGVELYAPEKDASSHERLVLPGELRAGIASGELVVYYQPKVALQSGTVTGVEALVRWQHPRRGLVPPNEFIPMAEQSGLINALTNFVLEEALVQCRTWRDSGHELTVAVNVAPRTLHDEDFPDALAVILARTGCPAAALTLEITEDDIMAEPARTIAVLERLAAMGVQLAVDDLGTGYSSLSYLRRLPVHEVKVDRSFVMDMAQDRDNAAIVEAIVALGQRLGKRIVAEGVEDEDTYRALASMGCDVAQGFWLSRPVPAGDLTAWLLGWPAQQPLAGTPLAVA